MRFRRFAGADLDVGAVVAQMDRTVEQLREAWYMVDSKFAILFTQQQADAANARLATLRALIDDLDVGGVARQHVFFPLPGQTSEQAWATWVETATYVRDGLMQVGGFVSKWSLSSVLPRIVKDVGDNASTLVTALTWVAGGLVAIELIRTFRPR